LTEAKDRALGCYEKAGFCVVSGSETIASWGKKKLHVFSKWQKLSKVPTWSCCPQKIEKKLSGLEQRKGHISCFYVFGGLRMFIIVQEPSPSWMLVKCDACNFNVSVSQDRFSTIR